MANRDNTKNCPICDRSVKANSVKCKHRGHPFSTNGAIFKKYTSLPIFAGFLLSFKLYFCGLYWSKSYLTLLL